MNFQNLVKTWWSHKIFTKEGKAAFYRNRFFFLLVTFLRFTVKFGLNLAEFQNLQWKLGENPVSLQNLVNIGAYPNLCEFRKPGKRFGESQNLGVKTWWAYLVFTKQTKEAFFALKDSGSAKMYREGGAGNYSYISIPPPSETGIYCMNFFPKSLCGVLVFGCALPRARLLLLAASSTHKHLSTHNLLTHTHNLLTPHTLDKNGSLNRSVRNWVL